MPSLYLKYEKELIPEGGKEVLRSSATLLKAKWYEPAGHLFHEFALKQSGHTAEAEAEDTEGSANGSSKGESDTTDSSAWEHGKTKKKGKDGDHEQDHYAMIGLAHLRYLATDDQIKKAYREAALKFHPDKLNASLSAEELSEALHAAKKDEIETRFKNIQLAYEILTDPVKRRNFDSMDEFDDEIPSDCAPEDFFKVFGPVFLRNGRWSTVQPCPMPGDSNTPLSDVDAFYDHWWAFKSWREFPNEDEHDVEAAEGREHKRWMERQNAKLREKAKKEEVARVRQLVENAYRRDPRILQRREDEKLEKQRRKEAKNASKRAAEEAERRAAEEERVRREEEERRAVEEERLKKKEREKEKKLVRKERQRLRAAAAACVAGAPIGRAAEEWGVPDDDVEALCQALSLDRMRVLCETLECHGENRDRKAVALRRWLAAVSRDGNGDGSWNGNAPLGEAEAEAESERAFGAGTANREAPAGTPTPPPSPAPAPAVAPVPQSNGVHKEAKKAEASKKEAGPKPGAGSSSSKGGGEKKPWGREELELLRKALGKFPKGTSQRWEVVGEYLGTGRTVEEILKAVKYELLKKPDDSKSFEVFIQKRKNGKEISSPLSVRDDGEKTASKETSKGSGKTDKSDEKSTANGNGNATADSPSGSSGETSTWSEAQEVALVKAIKAFPKETENRWERIASAVPGKTKAQCFKKFSSLRDNFRSKKTAT